MSVNHSLHHFENNLDLELASYTFLLSFHVNHIYIFFIQNVLILTVLFKNGKNTGNLR